MKFNWHLFVNIVCYWQNFGRQTFCSKLVPGKFVLFIFRTNIFRTEPIITQVLASHKSVIRNVRLNWLLLCFASIYVTGCRKNLTISRPVTFVLKSYHDDLGHQGRDRTASLIKGRFFWPRMNKFIRNYVQKWGRCICRKAPQVKSAHLVNKTSSAPMELVCTDYLSGWLREYSGDHRSL